MTDPALTHLITLLAAQAARDYLTAQATASAATADPCTHPAPLPQLGRAA